MKRAAILLMCLAVFLVHHSFGQNCTTLGQNPGTAFPVCGTMQFSQTTVPLCGGTAIPGPCNEVILEDLNPFWYKFTCYQAGTLGFEITPNTLTDDYDWQLFDITGRSTSEVYTNADLFVACNWSGYGGKTGASDLGTDLASCSGDNPIWSSMPELIEGHEYLLLVSHFTGGQSGYNLEFKGGTAGITDDVAAIIQNTEGLCTGNSMFVKLNKPIKCSSLAADGSDFGITAGTAQVVGATSPQCRTSFTADSIIIQFNNALPEGTYSINLKDGSDGNTLVNNCDISMAPATMQFRMYESVSANFAYQIREGCTTDTVHFIHDGGNNVNSWNWSFDEGIAVTQSPVVAYTTSGNKSARLIVANDYCSDTSEAMIELSPNLDAAFSGPKIICAKDLAAFTDNSTGGAINYRWNFGDVHYSSEQNPSPFNFPSNGGEKKHKVSLTITDDAGCSDSAVAEVVVVGNCNIMVPSAFSPNKDGRNDELYPSNAFNADELVFRVFNRFGQIVFESRDWTRKWDGNVNGQTQPVGTYVWTLSYKLKATGKSYFFKGTTTLIR